MVLEATLIGLDNSEWMRNGDYYPTRMEAQVDAVNSLMGWKFSANPESTVGLMKMAKGTEILVSPSTDAGKILSALHSVKINGKLDLMSSIQVAQLALKHRLNKNQLQRMILFVGSPVENIDSKALKRLGAALKKNNVAVDIISFGEFEENNKILEEFIQTVDSGGNSHLVTIESSSSKSLIDAIRASPIRSGGGGGGGSGGDGGDDFPFGVDPNEDPELLMAMRASMEEAQRSMGTGATPMDIGGGNGGGGGGEGGGGEGGDEDDLLAQAIAMSMEAAQTQQQAQQQKEQQPSSSPTSSSSSSSAAVEITETVPKSELPKKEGDEKKEEKKPPTGAEPSASIANPDFVNEVLQSLPGVDLNDPQIKELLKGINTSSSTTPTTTTTTTTSESKNEQQEQKKDDDMDDEAAMELALQMSLAAEEDKTKNSQDKKE